ncbi:LON peptidase substrate-binding domain-containing protein [Salinifilum aidingensis]
MCEATVDLPLFPLNSVLLPGGSLQLRVFEKRYRELVSDLCEHVVPDSLFGIVAIRQGWEVGTDNVDAMYDIGVTARLSRTTSLPADQYEITAAGEQRFRLLQVDYHAAPYLMGRVEPLPDTEAESDSPQRRARLAESARRVRRDYRAVAESAGRSGDPEPAGASAGEEDPEDVALLSYRLADDCVLSPEDRQDVLSETDPLARLRLACRLVRRETFFRHRLGAVPAALAEFAQESSSN